MTEIATSSQEYKSVTPEDLTAIKSEITQLVKIITDDKDVNVKINAIKYIHAYLQDENLITYFVKDLKLYSYLLQQLLSNNPKLVQEIAYLFVVTFSINNDDIDEQLTQINFLSTLTTQLSSPEWQQNMRDFDNSLDIQRLIYLAISNMSGHVIFHEQISTSPVFLKLLQTELTRINSERVRKCLVLALSGVVYQAETQTEYVSQTLNILLDNLNIFGEEETFATFSALAAYLCCQPDRYEPKNTLIFDKIETEYQQLQANGGLRDGRIEESRVIREGLRILNNLSLGAGTGFFVAETSARLFNLYKLLKNTQKMSNFVVQILLNISSIETTCSALIRQPDAKELLLEHMKIGEELGADLTVQIFQNAFFYGVQGGYSDEIGRAVMQMASYELVKNADKRFLDRLLNLTNQMIQADNRYMKMLKDFQFQNYEGKNAIVDQILEKFRAWYAEGQRAISQ